MEVMAMHRNDATTWPQAMKNLFVAGVKFILVVWAFMALVEVKRQLELDGRTLSVSAELEGIDDEAQP